ncbi:MAG: rane dipeptidase [Bacteroidales bacterium]|jgi:membrane dipeptidase|nr:rane dipeptidase [Bacteroidales bacterium]MDN5328925.1 rane dipeptidase [Bacteroidales bacterium]NPV35180.1 membrane dipeptidase [Bacteroidales bacterium]
MRKLLLVNLLTFSFLVSFCQSTNEENIRELHRRLLTLDSHTDTPLWLLREGLDFMNNNRLKAGSKVDYPRMQEGGLDAVFMAVFTPQGKTDSMGYSQAYAQAQNLFDAIRQLVGKHPEQLSLATHPDQILLNAEKGKVSLLIGVENGYPIGENLSRVEEFYQSGARYITLSHTRNNQICDASTDEPSAGGLTAFGREVVVEMNRLGMLVDVSHISDSAFYDVLRISTKPVIASHSNARAVCNHPRNLTDDMLKAIAARGGVVQVCLLSDYVKTFPPNPARDSALKAWESRYPDYGSLDDANKAKARAERRDIDQQFPRPKATVSDLVDHIDHIVKVAGIDHVGVGSDFDGGGGLVDCQDVSEMWRITAELVKRGYTYEDLTKIWGGNFLRVWRANLR